MVREMLSSFLIVPAPHAVKSITFSMLAKLHSLVESVISVALRYSFFDPRLLRELQSLAWSAQACDSHGRGNEELPAVPCWHIIEVADGKDDCLHIAPDAFE